MKKILFLVTQSEFGGAQRYILEVASAFKSEGYPVLVAAGEGDNQLFKKLEKTGVRWHALKKLKRVPGPLKIISAVFEISHLLKKEGPEVLFLGSTAAGILGSIAASLFKLTTKNYQLKTIYRIGGWAFNDPRPWWQRKIIILAEKLTASLKTQIIVNSEFDLQSALKYKIAPKKKLVKIYNGIDAEKLDFLPSEEAKEFLSSKLKAQGSKSQFESQNLRIIGTVANFYKTKGLEYLIKAARILNSQFPIFNFQLLIIGDGLERGNLEDLIKKSNLQNKVVLLGRIPDSYRYLKAFDVFVLPSLKEGFPWVILEAMAAGLPIVASEVGALPEIIKNGKSGFLVQPKESENLAKKIRDLLQNPELRNEFTKMAKEKLNEFSLQTMLQKTKEVIEN